MYQFFKILFSLIFFSGNGRDESSTYQNTTNYDDCYQKKLSEANLQLFKYVKVCLLSVIVLRKDTSI